jgi:hypothetical protein
MLNEGECWFASDPPGAGFCSSLEVCHN